MRCEAVTRALSAAMDEPGRSPLDPESAAHAAACPSCSAFREGAWRLRELARFEVAPPVPDLVPAIMAAVRAEPGAGARRSTHARGAERDGVRWGDPRRSGARERRTVAAAAAMALLAGFVAGAAATGTLVPHRGVAALAREIPRRLVHAAETLTGYRATFRIVERDWTRQVATRTFVATVGFRAPEAFVVRVRDTTAYPSPAWPRNDLALSTDGRTWHVEGPDPCPRAALPGCQAGRVSRTVTGRAPFEPATPMPTDVVVPMTVLAASDRVEVLGAAEVGGRDAVAVRLAYRDASPLFAYLRFLGSWRPFFPEDRVVVWLDERTWFPLRYAVFPAGGAERARWSSQMGLPPERPDVPVFTATAGSLLTSAPPPAAFAVRRDGGATASTDQGFRDVAVVDRATEGARPASGGPWIEPTWRSGLRLWRAGAIEPSPSRPYRQSVLAYASGLSWLTVTRIEGWNERRAFGVGPFAERVALGPAGMGYYEPASADAPRRLAVHTAAGELLLATDLPRADLLRAAASLPVTGLPQPGMWRVHRWAGGVVEDGLSPTAALSRLPFPAALPTFLPRGYRAVSAERVATPATTGVTVVFRRPAAELDGPGLLLYQGSGQVLAPPADAGVQAVRIGPLTARWSPEQHLLEWTDAGLYRSLAAPGLDLATMARIAASLAPLGAGTEGGS